MLLESGSLEAERSTEDSLEALREGILDGVRNTGDKARGNECEQGQGNLFGATRLPSEWPCDINTTAGLDLTSPCC